MHKYGESKTTRIMMATVRHLTSSSGLRKFQADGFLLDGVYLCIRRAIKQTVGTIYKNFVQHPAVKVNSICRGNYWGSSMLISTQQVNN